MFIPHFSVYVWILFASAWVWVIACKPSIYCTHCTHILCSHFEALSALVVQHNHSPLDRRHEHASGVWGTRPISAANNQYV